MTHTSFVNVSTLLLLVLCTACGSGDKKSSPSGAAVGNTGGTNKIVAPQALLDNSWCINQNTANPPYQQRITLKDTGDINLTYFYLTAEGARGAVAQQADGKWSIANDTVTTVFDGQSQDYKIRLDPESPTGAPQLHIGNTADQMVAFDPCS